MIRGWLLELLVVVFGILDERKSSSCQSQWWSCPWLPKSYCLERHRSRCAPSCWSFSILSCSWAAQSNFKAPISRGCVLPSWFVVVIQDGAAFRLTGCRFPYIADFPSSDCGISLPCHLPAFTEIAPQTRSAASFSKIGENSDVSGAHHFSWDCWFIDWEFGWLLRSLVHFYLWLLPFSPRFWSWTYFWGCYDCARGVGLWWCEVGWGGREGHVVDVCGFPWACGFFRVGTRALWFCCEYWWEIWVFCVCFASFFQLSWVYLAF